MPWTKVVLGTSTVVQFIFGAAATYLAINGLFVAISVVLMLLTALTPPGIPLNPATVYCWRCSTEHEQPLTLDQTGPARFRARAGDHGPRRLRRARFYVRRSVAEHTVATIAIQYVAGFYLAGAIGATYTLRQATWSAARTYLASALALIGVFTLITIVGLLTPPGLQPIACLYVLLSILSLPLVAWVWRQEAARMAAYEQPAAVVRT